MAISQNQYVDITSAVAGAAATGAPSLQHRRITTGTLMKPGGGQAAAGEVVTITYSMLPTLEQFLTSDKDRQIARQYFAMKTTPPVSKPSSIEFVSYVADDAVPPSVVSGASITIEDAKDAEDKEMTVTTSGTTATVTVTGIDEVTDMEEVVLALSVLDGMPSGLTFEASEGSDSLTVTSPEYGTPDEAQLSFEGEAADLLGLSASAGATTTLGGGLNAVDAFIASYDRSKNFGTYSIEGLRELGSGQMQRLRDFHAAFNVLHQLYIELPRKHGIEDMEVYTTFKDVPMVGFILSETEGEHKLVIPAGLIDATDWEGRNTVNQIMFRQASGMKADVDNDADKLALDRLLVSYYGQTAVNATPLSFFQKGNLQGTALDPRDMMVAAAEQWIKGKVASDLINTLVASRIPANRDGEARIRTMIINGAVAASLRSGAIMKLKDLTQLQKEVIYDMTGDDLAWADVMNDGFWLEVGMRSVVVDGVEEKHAHYTLIYAKADFVRKIVGSHNLV